MSDEYFDDDLNHELHMKELAAKDAEIDALKRELRARGAAINTLDLIKADLQSEIATLKAENDGLRNAAKAYQELSCCYRLGKRPTEKLFSQLEKANKILADSSFPDARK